MLFALKEKEGKYVVCIKRKGGGICYLHYKLKRLLRRESLN